MADLYIDYDETRIYGDYAIDRINEQVAGRLPDFDPALRYALAALRSATDAVAAHLHVARAANAGLHTEVAGRERPLADARDALTRFARHLESHKAGALPYASFFVEPPATLATRGPSRVVAALDHVLGTLDEHRTLLREADYWRNELQGARHALAGTAAPARRPGSPTANSPALAAAREHWLVIYGSTKHLVAAVLALSGSPRRLDEIFDDMAEVHRTDGVYDDAEPETTSAAAPAQTPAQTPATPA